MGGLRKPHQLTLDRARQNVLAKVGGPGAVTRLLDFYDPKGGYAGLSFLDAFPTGRSSIGAGDLLAPGLMSAPLTAKQVRAVETVLPQVRAALRRVPANADLANISITELEGPAGQLWHTLRDALDTEEGSKTKARLKADKLCARKRPGLFPISDERVTGVVRSRAWLTFRHLMSDGGIVAALTLARTRAAQTNAPIGGLPLLRVLDTILWMP